MMTPQCHVTIPLKLNMISVDLPRLNGILSAFLRLCIISVVKFPTYTFYSDFLKIEFDKKTRQLVICDTAPLN